MLAIFLKFILPFLLQELVQSGAMSELEASAITSVKDFVVWIKSIKTYSEPSDFPDPNKRNRPF